MQTHKARTDLLEQQKAGAYEELLARLSRQSVDKHSDAYSDVPWDDPEMQILPEDIRLALWPGDPIATTEWYAALSDAHKARLGIWRVATAMRIGSQFENILQRGLLGFAMRLPNGAPEHRYLHHEIVEESQHTMMFQEFVNRTGLNVRGMPKSLVRIAELFVLPLQRAFPPLFFLFVLGGEDPIDHVQRLALRDGLQHPLLERIMRIHVAEEARHLSFARHYLKRTVPRLGPVRRRILAFAAPILFAVMARMMVLPPPRMRALNRVPRSVARQARDSEQSRKVLRDSVAKPRRLCEELGLVGPVSRLEWRLFGIWDRPDG